MFMASTPRVRFYAAAVFVLISVSAASGPGQGKAEGASAEALIEAEHWKQARALVEPMLQANPRDARANFLMARVLEASRDYDRALAFAERAVAQEPKNADYHCLLSLVYGRQAISAGILRKIGLARRVRREAETAIELNPRHVEARQILVEYHLQAPGILGGDKNKARALAEELAGIDAVRGCLAQASIAHRLRQEDRLEGLYKKAVEADPQSYQALTSLANYYIYGASRSNDLVERYASEAAAVAPDRARAHGLLAQAFAGEKRWAELDALLERAEKNVPGDLSPYFQAGRVILRQGPELDLERAERYFRKYLTQEPELAAPSKAQAYWRLAQTLERSGRKPEAVEALKEALRLEPNLEGVKRDLKRLH
jgi:tetratricopeptide (TPR) repeat protein